MPSGFGFVAVEGAAEVADLGEAAHGSAGDVLGLAVAALAVVLDEEPAVGVFPGFFFILRQMAPGGAAPPSPEVTNSANGNWTFNPVRPSRVYCMRANVSASPRRRQPRSDVLHTGYAYGNATLD